MSSARQGLLSCTGRKIALPYSCLSSASFNISSIHSSSMGNSSSSNDCCGWPTGSSPENIMSEEIKAESSWIKNSGPFSGKALTEDDRFISGFSNAKKEPFCVNSRFKVAKSSSNARSVWDRLLICRSSYPFNPLLLGSSESLVQRDSSKKCTLTVGVIHRPISHSTNIFFMIMCPCSRSNWQKLEIRLRHACSRVPH